MSTKINKSQADDFLTDAQKELEDEAKKEHMKKVIRQGQQRMRRVRKRAKELKIDKEVGATLDRKVGQLTTKGDMNQLYENYNKAYSFIASKASSLTTINELGQREQRKLVDDFGTYFERAYGTSRIDKLRRTFTHDVLQRLDDLADVKGLSIEDLDIATLYRNFAGEFMFAAIDYSRSMKSDVLRAIDFQSGNYRDRVDAAVRDIYEQVASIRNKADSMIDSINSDYDTMF